MRRVLFSALIGFTAAQNCAQLYDQVTDFLDLTKYPSHAACKVNTPDVYCTSTACSNLTAIAKSIVPNCPVNNTAMLFPNICTTSCNDQLNIFASAYQDCTTLPLTLATAANCKACRKLNSTAFQADMVSKCGQVTGGMASFYSSTPKIMTSFGICANAPVTDASAADSDSGNGSTIYVIIGIAVAVLAILGAVIYKLKLKNDIAKHKFDYINETDGGMQMDPNFSNPDVIRIANDIRFDEELAQFRIPQQEIQNISLLVKGGYGVVFHASFGTDEVAMKQLLPSKSKDFNAIQEFMNEIRLCARLEHKNIVKFIGISWSTLHDLAVLSEFMPRGDVSTLLKKDFKKAENHRLLHWESGLSRECATTKGTIAADIADSLVYLHSFQPTIIHRDLKSKNVLLAEDWTAKLSDFGISRVTSLEESMTSNIGTVAWIAPEVLTGGHYTEKADIYSFGVLLSEIDTCEVPYSNMIGKSKDSQFSNARIAMMVSEGSLRPSFSDCIPEEILLLAQECLAFDPSERPAAMTLSYKLHTIVKNL
ncbi:kinase [Thraustotheca clavata]|uniref:Kinase n=1 Tax=Thraustotheca clavata TaxID=74557 RepID=A0A1W0AAU2_9STRA|nr:kinase [Thraustotheca clavata]